MTQTSQETRDAIVDMIEIAVRALRDRPQEFFDALDSRMEAIGEREDAVSQTVSLMARIGFMTVVGAAQKLREGK